jgi:hypothetical protein
MLSIHSAQVSSQPADDDSIETHRSSRRRIYRMDATIQSQLTNLVQGRRLLIYSSEIAAQRNHSPGKPQTTKEMMDEDVALISGDYSTVAAISSQSAYSASESTSINLSELSAKFKSAQTEDNGATITAQEVTFTQTVEEQLNIRVVNNSPVEGLVRHSNQSAETDRYSFDFTNGTTFTILDKWTGKSTSVWGDPHVDVSDVQGASNGDFKDLKSSDTVTTFMLKDGTRVTFTAPDNEVIQQVDIYKGDQHLQGIGSGSSQWNEKNEFFAKPVDSSSASRVPMGDVVYAGGDGTDWYDSSGRLIWGKVTAPDVNMRPASFVEIQYQRMETSSLKFTQVNQNA